MKNNTVHWSYNGGSSVIKHYTGAESRGGGKYGGTWDSKLMEEEERRERRRRQRQKVVNCCKQGVAFMFSHVGLAGMVVAYSILGGFIFQYLEAANESNEREVMRKFKAEQIERIWGLVEGIDLSYGLPNRTNFTGEVAKIMLDFQIQVYISVKEDGWDGTDGTDGNDQQWSFAGALLFAVTVITTIGYGHIAPKTSWGRFVTILYALVGIPLTFLYLSNIGNFLADCFRLFYKKICCDICCCQKCEREKKHKRILAKRKKLASQRNMLLAQHSQLYNSSERHRPQPSTESEESICHSLEDIREGSHSPEPALPRCSSAPRMCGSLDLSSSGKTTPGSTTGNDKLYHTLPTRRTSMSLDKFPVGAGASPTRTLSPPGSGGKPGAYNSMRSPPPYRPLPMGTTLPPSYRQSVTSTDRLLPSENEASELELRETDILDDDEDVRETAIIDSDTDEEKMKNKQLLSPMTTTFSDGFFDRLGDSKETDIVDSDHEIETLQTEADISPAASTKKKKKYSKSVSPKRSGDNLCPPNVNESVSRTNSAKSQKSARSVSLNESQCDATEETSLTVPSGQPLGKDKNSRKSRKDKDKKDRAGSSKKSPSATVEDKPSKSLSRSRSRKGEKESKKDKDLSLPKSKKESRSKSKDKKEDKSTKSSTKDKKDNGNSSKSKHSEKLTLPNNKTDLRNKNLSTKVKRQDSKRNKNNLGAGDGVDRDRQTSSKSQKSQASSSTGHTGASFDIHGSDESFVTAYSESSLCTEEEDEDDIGAVGGGGTTDVTITKQPPSTPAVSFGDDDIAIEMDPQYEFNRFNQMAFLDDNMDLDIDDDGDKVTVPIPVCLIIITGYILAGAVLFTLWEKEWDLLTGSYFCFITLSTIGFGDIVPGMKMDSWGEHQKLVLCSLWLAFGLSLLAMCFNLMQEEVKEKVKWLGHKIGLLKDDDET